LVPTNPPPVRVVLCASAKDPGHGAPGFHDYPLWRERWARLLSLAENVQVETADRWPSPAQWAAADVVAFYHDNPAWVADKAADLDAFLARGGGLVFLHWSMNAYKDLDALKPRLGRAWGPGARFRYGPEELSFPAHPLTAGLSRPLAVVDEAYWNLPGEDAGSTVLATSMEEGQPRPQAWIRETGKGRVFVCIPGHFTWTFDDPLYRVFWLRGLAWAARQAPDRFADLVGVGARVGDGRP
ncbi:MAG: ThuA domain-containing protein, partial [Verrucomicrobiota bacterium]